MFTRIIPLPAFPTPSWLTTLVLTWQKSWYSKEERQQVITYYIICGQWRWPHLLPCMKKLVHKCTHLHRHLHNHVKTHTCTETFMHTVTHQVGKFVNRMPDDKYLFVKIYIWKISGTYISFIDIRHRLSRTDVSNHYCI